MATPINTRSVDMLSNFYRLDHPIQDALGIQFITVEGFYQAHKTNDKQIRDRISLADSRMSNPRWAGLGSKKAGYKISPIVANWNEIKIQVMKEALQKKFMQKRFGECLISTGNAYIYEGSLKDTFWGTGSEGPDGPGHNWLGKLLMELRADLTTLA